MKILDGPFSSLNVQLVYISYSKIMNNTFTKFVEFVVGETLYVELMVISENDVLNFTLSVASLI